MSLDGGMKGVPPRESQMRLQAYLQRPRLPLSNSLHELDMCIPRADLRLK